MFADSRIRCLGLLALLFMLVNLVTRLVLSGMPGPEQAIPLLAVFAAGVWNDVLALGWFLLLPAVLLLLPPWGRAARGVSVVVFALGAAVLLFTAVAEGFFWDEFNARFNFVAVDYLIYTTEVLNNIKESYPVFPLLAGIGLLAAGSGWLFARTGQKQQAPALPYGRRVLVTAGCAALAVASFGLAEPVSISQRPIVADMAHNGLYALFSAYRHNQLDYRRFYAGMDDGEARSLLREELAETGVSFVATDEPLLRHVRNAGPEKRLNVIQIVVESLGSASLGEFTPEIARLREQSLSFTNMLATGTRTVRGIEALTLSLPPTPGSSIVRRPGNDGLFTTGSLFATRGYDTTFVYGGYGYFDNMNAYFEGNGFRIVDRANMDKVTFGNAWGVCDEDLYTAALAEADTSYAAGRPFYQFVLTTSNHRPFTYPDGRVSIPSGSSRKGAVAYSDYAIGQFLREAASKPWFDDTIFIIVADHTAGSAGGTALSPANYAIPCLIYSPRNVQPASINTLCSQIDVAPTLFALLGWSYDTAFFGKNILTMADSETGGDASGRAYIGTYQLLGRLADNNLVVLEPLKQPRLERTGTADRQAVSAEAEARRVTEAAIAPYQTIQDMFTSGRLRETAGHIRTAAGRHMGEVSLRDTPDAN